MAGQWHLSRTQILDQNDNLLPGALAYFFEAGTSTPMTTYSSVSLGEINEHSHPVAADGNARWPNVFFDDEAFQFYRVRVTDAGGVLIYDDDSVPIIGQAEGGGGGPVPVPIDENGLAKTGDVKVRFDNAALAGWVRMNGKTIGKSAGTERADPDTQDLYSHLWSKANQTICEVIGGRGANALADFDAGKQLTLPDMRGRAAFGIDNMNNAPSGRIAAAYMDTGGINELGASGGDDAIALATTEIPAHLHDTAGDPAAVAPNLRPPLTIVTHTHKLVADVELGPAATNPVDVNERIALQWGGTGGSGSEAYEVQGTLAAGATLATSGPPSTLATTGYTGLTGGGLGHENMPPFMLFTYYIKL